MACIIEVSLQINIWSIWPQMVVEHDLRSKWRRPSSEPRDAPLGGCCGEMTEKEGRTLAINNPPHLSRHLYANDEGEQFYLEERSKVRIYDTTRPWGSMQLHGSTKSRAEQVRPTVGKDRVSIFVVWQDEMKMRWCLSTTGSPEYILSSTHSTSITSGSLFTLRCSVTLNLEAVIERIWTCTWMSRSSELRDALGGHERANLAMHFETVITRVSWCNWRSWLSEFRDTLRGSDQARLEMQLETNIEWTQRCTWRPWSSKFRDALGGQDWGNSEIHSEAVI